MLDGAQGRTLTREQRAESAVRLAALLLEFRFRAPNGGPRSSTHALSLDARSVRQAVTTALTDSHLSQS